MFMCCGPLKLIELFHSVGRWISCSTLNCLKRYVVFCVSITTHRLRGNPLWYFHIGHESFICRLYLYPRVNINSLLAVEYLSKKGISLCMGGLTFQKYMFLLKPLSYYLIQRVLKTKSPY
jgi:hypothetical protein